MKAVDWAFILRALTLAAIMGLCGAVWGNSFALGSIGAKVEALNQTIIDVKLDVRELRKDR